MYAVCSFKRLKNKRKKSLFTCLTINGPGSRKLAPNEKGLRPLKDNSSRRNKRKVRYGLALVLEKIINKQKTSLEHFESFESHQKTVNIMSLMIKKL